jgi:hypothetical protein
VVYAVGGSILMTIPVVVTEGRACDDLARSRGRVGAAFATATGVPLLTMALLAGVPNAWRGLWLAHGLTLLAVPWLWRRLHETSPIRCGATRAPGPGVGPPPRRFRSLRLLVAAALVLGVDFTVRAWLFYHPVRSLGIGGAMGIAAAAGSALSMTLVSLGAGTLGGAGPAVALVVALALPAASVCLSGAVCPARASARRPDPGAIGPLPSRPA